MRKFNLYRFLIAMLFVFLSVKASAQSDITNTAGTITAQYTDSPAGEDIAKLIDNSSSTKYLTFHNAGWVQFRSTTAYVVTRYSITSANDSDERDPKDWTFQGSNNGTTWTTINTQTNQDFPSRLQRREFSFVNTVAYTYFRLQMTNNSGAILQLSEWEIFGTTTLATVATMYTDCEFTGTSAGLTVGDYTLAQLQSKGINDNMVSSVKVGSGYQVIFYDNDNFAGASITVIGDDNCLVDNNYNDRATSLRVQVSNPTTSVPAAPSYTRAIGLDAASIQVTFKDNSNNETSFRIERSIDGTNFTSVGTAPANATSFVNAGLSAATKYFYRVRAENANGNSPYSNNTGAYTRETPPATLSDYVGNGSHAETMTLITYNDDVAFYGDNSFVATHRAQVDTWVKNFVTENWKYIKANYGHYGANRLYCFMHNRSGANTIASMFDSYSRGRNTIDVYSTTWQSNDYRLKQVMTHEMAHIIEGSSLNVHESPFFSIWGDSKWAEIHIYDLYFKTGIAAHQPSYDEFAGQATNGVYWMRDWFYPLWRDYGQTRLLINMFDLLSKHFPKTLIDNTYYRYSRRANMGEFFYFLSGAAGVSLKEKGTQVFGWPATTEAEWNQAKKDYPQISFTGKNTTGGSLLLTDAESTTLGPEIVNIFPNPSKSIVTISLSEAVKESRIKINVYSSTGKLLKNMETANDVTDVNLSDLDNGVYLLEISAGKMLYKKKIFKEDR